MRWQMIQLLLALMLLAGCSARQATLHTSKGDIVVELDAKAAPATVDNFVQYAKDGFYDGTIFHRVVHGFVIQGGGFTQDGTQKQTRDAIGLEAGKSNLRGTIAMARTNDPNSATSQFFINLADNTFLDPAPGQDGYAVFGKVTQGMDVVDAIAAGQVGPMDWPNEPVVLSSVTIH